MTSERIGLYLFAFGIALALHNGLWLAISAAFRRAGRNVSPILIPFLAPLGIVTGAILLGWNRLWILAAFADAGTWAIVPEVGRAYATSRHTRVWSAAGWRGHLQARVDFHRNGWFAIRLNWVRKPGSRGIVETSWTGKVQETNQGYMLTGDSISVEMIRSDENEYLLRFAGLEGPWREFEGIQLKRA